MSNEHTALDAAANERKSRLAKLASLKRKRLDVDVSTAQTPSAGPDLDAHVPVPIENVPAQTDRYISGRNYDTTTKGPKLGFEHLPHAQHETVEQEALRISKEAADQAIRDEAEADKGLDLFRLQPKKPNWDLKRDLAERTRPLDTRTQNAIARLVRERIQRAKEDASKAKIPTSADESEELGVEGNTLVEAVHLREKEDEHDRRRAASDDEDGIGIP